MKLFETEINVFTVELEPRTLLRFTVRFHLWSKIVWLVEFIWNWVKERKKERRSDWNERANERTEQNKVYLHDFLRIRLG